jgi:MFS family permease
VDHRVINFCKHLYIILYIKFISLSDLDTHLQSILGKSAFTSGLVLLPGALIMAVMMLISGRLFDKHGVKKLAIPGIILLVIIIYMFTLFINFFPLATKIS